MTTTQEHLDAKRYLQFVDRGIVEHFDGIVPSQQTIDQLESEQRMEKLAAKFGPKTPANQSRAIVPL